MNERDEKQSRNHAADYVKTRRLALGLTQEDVADLTGMSQRWVSKVEAEGFSAPRMATLRRLATALQLPLDDLLINVGFALTGPGAQRVADSATEADDPDSPLTPEEEAVLSRLTFMGYSQLSNAQLREIIRIVTKGQ
jgi:transcriptional regulator with XRE-family HTH domain